MTQVMTLQTTRIYVVTTQTDNFTKTLGYATGSTNDIEMYYQDQQVYGIEIKSVDVIHVTPEVLKNKQMLIEEKEELEARLKSINNKLENFF